MQWNKVLIYDDIEAFAQEIKELLQELLPNAEIITASTEETALLHIEQCDLLFLDIELEEGRNGVQLSQRIREKLNPYCTIIFVSGYNYNIEIAYNEGDGYLVKPVTLNRLKVCLQKLSKKKESNRLLIPVKNGAEMLLTDQILFIENFNSRYAKYCNADGTELVSTYKFKDLCETLPKCFCRCHKSYYVNLNHVTSYRRYHFVLDNGMTISISPNRYSEAIQKYEMFIGAIL